MKLAFELNGIYHYEPIHGDDTLKRIQNNDKRKFQACLAREIELCIIDSSNLKYFKESKAYSFFKIIVDIISSKKQPSTRIELVLDDYKSTVLPLN